MIVRCSCKRLFDRTYVYNNLAAVLAELTETVEHLSQHTHGSTGWNGNHYQVAPVNKFLKVSQFVHYAYPQRGLGIDAVRIHPDHPVGKAPAFEIYRH